MWISWIGVVLPSRRGETWSFWSIVMTPFSNGNVFLVCRIYALGRHAAACSWNAGCHTTPRSCARRGPPWSSFRDPLSFLRKRSRRRVGTQPLDLLRENQVRDRAFSAARVFVMMFLWRPDLRAERRSALFSASWCTGHWHDRGSLCSRFSRCNCRKTFKKIEQP